LRPYVLKNSFLSQSHIVEKTCISPRERKFGANVRSVGQESSSASSDNSTPPTSNKAGGWGRAGGSAGTTATPVVAAAPQNPLEQLAVFLGIHGKYANAPALMGVPETPIPLIYIALVVLVGIVFRNVLIPVLAVAGFYGYQYSKLTQV
jgi:hypothetical protein